MASQAPCWTLSLSAEGVPSVRLPPPPSELTRSRVPFVGTLQHLLQILVLGRKEKALARLVDHDAPVGYEQPQSPGRERRRAPQQSRDGCREMRGCQRDRKGDPQAGSPGSDEAAGYVQDRAERVPPTRVHEIHLAGRTPAGGAQHRLHQVVDEDEGLLDLQPTPQHGEEASPAQAEQPEELPTALALPGDKAGPEDHRFQSPLAMQGEQRLLGRALGDLVRGSRAARRGLVDDGFVRRAHGRGAREMHEATDTGLQRLARERLGTGHVHPPEDFRSLAGREAVGDLRTGVEYARDPLADAAQRSGLGEVAHAAQGAQTCCACENALASEDGMAMRAPTSAETSRAHPASPVGVLAEPLEANAATAWRLAPGLCARAPTPERSCAWYHAIYSTLRLLGLAASPERHARFFSDALGRSALAGFERVLVSGAADTAMLAQLLAAYSFRAGARPLVQVLDRCETPLLLCRDYARLVGWEIETRKLDLLDPHAREQPARAFDLICTHSLLALFPPAAKRGAIAAWRAQLRRGGKVASTLRIDPEAALQGAGRSLESTRAFRERVLALASAWPGALVADPVQVADAAELFAARVPSWPVASQQELVGVLEQGGFAIEQLDVVGVPGSLSAASAGPGTARHATYAEFVAVRL